MTVDETGEGERAPRGEGGGLTLDAARQVHYCMRSALIWYCCVYVKIVCSGFFLAINIKLGIRL